MELVLKDKVAVVTGASKGIGKTVAIGLAKEGCRVVLCARGKEDLEKAAREIRETKGVGGVLPIAADVTKANEVEVLISQTVGRFGRVDILVNNAEESAGACLSTNSQTRSGSKYST